MFTIDPLAIISGFVWNKYRFSLLNITDAGLIALLIFRSPFMPWRFKLCLYMPFEFHKLIASIISKYFSFTRNTNAICVPSLPSK